MVSDAVEWSDRAPPVRQTGGVVRRGNSARKKTNERLLFTNKGRLPPTKKLRVELACWQAHYGLCISTDAAIFSRTCSIQKGLAKFFKKDKLLKHYVLADGSAGAGSPHPDDFLWFAHLRPRRPEVYVTTAFVKERLQDEQLHVQRTEEGGLAYVGIYGVAKSVARKGWEVLAIQQVIVGKGQHPAPVDVSAPAAERVIAWPPSKATIPASKAAKVKVDADLDGLPGEEAVAKVVKAKTKKRGGVDYVTPLKSLEKKAKSAKDLPGDVTSSDEPSDESDGSSSCSAPALKEKKRKHQRASRKALPRGRPKPKPKPKARLWPRARW